VSILLWWCGIICFFAVDYFRTRQVGPKPEYPSCAVGLAPTDEHDGVVHMNFDA